MIKNYPTNEEIINMIKEFSKEINVSNKTKNAILYGYQEGILEILEIYKQSETIPNISDEQINKMLKDFIKNIDVNITTKKALQFGFQEGIFNMMEVLKNI